jgi:hypothetical protein
MFEACVTIRYEHPDVHDIRMNIYKICFLFLVGVACSCLSFFDCLMGGVSGEKIFVANRLDDCVVGHFLYLY